MRGFRGMGIGRIGVRTGISTRALNQIAYQVNGPLERIPAEDLKKAKEMAKEKELQSGDK